MKPGQKKKYLPQEIQIERSAFIWRLRVEEHLSYDAIAQRFHAMYGEPISLSTISTMLKHERLLRLEQIQDYIDRERMEQALFLEGVMREALHGWRRSQKETKKTIKGKRSGSNEKIGPFQEESEIIEAHEQIGDPRFLKVFIDASARKAKLLGLDMIAPEATPPETPEIDPFLNLAEAIRQSTQQIQAHPQLPAPESDTPPT